MIYYKKSEQWKKRKLRKIQYVANYMLERKSILIDITVIKSLCPKPVFKLQLEANHSLQYAECSSKGKQSLAATVLWK